MCVTMLWPNRSFSELSHGVLSPLPPCDQPKCKVDTENTHVLHLNNSSIGTV